MADQTKAPALTLGENVTATIDGDFLTVRINLATRLGETGSQLGYSVGTTHGNVPVPGTNKTLNVNCYEPKPKAEQARVRKLAKYRDAIEEAKFAAMVQAEAAREVAAGTAAIDKATGNGAHPPRRA